MTQKSNQEILEEIQIYCIELEEDPTLPQFGLLYISKVLAQCQSYTNRVNFYLQKLLREDLRLRSELGLYETDLSMKITDKLANDNMVRSQPHFEDRKALASAMLKNEHENIGKLKIELQDVQETVKILKLKLRELNGVNTNIKALKSIVKDDIQARMGGDGGHDKPQRDQDKTSSGGLPPPVREKTIDASFMLREERKFESREISESDSDSVNRFLDGIKTESESDDFSDDSILD
jgi:hypothetical protein